MSSFIRKPKRKIEIKDEDHTITLKNINLYELTDQYNLKNDIIEKEPPLKQSNFSIVDDQAVKKVSKFKEKSSLSNKKSISDISNLTSNLEKLGISNKELLTLETFYKDDVGKDIKMIKYGTNEYLNKDCKGHCWWCRHSIPSEWHPLGIPLKKDKENTYTCDGLFCSFNCIMAYIHTFSEGMKYKDSPMLVGQMYRSLFGKDIRLDKIIDAPSWKHLREYGGKMTIEEFRSTFNKLKFIERRVTPMTVEELKKDIFQKTNNPEVLEKYQKKFEETLQSKLSPLSNIQMYSLHTLNFVEKVN